MNRKNNDMLWKVMLEEVFDDLLRFVFPKADQVFDMKRGFEFLDKELAEMYPKPEKKSDTKFVDKLVKVYQKDGSEEWVLCHVEVQGKDEPTFAKRMFKYYCRIFDRFDRPMTAIAIFTGRDGKKLPGMYVRRYEGAELTYKYNTLCILDYEDKRLAASKNPFALVMLAAKKALLRGKHLDEILLKEKLSIAKLLIRRGFSESKTAAILSFLHNYVRFAKPETNRIFERELDLITGKTNTMGIIEYVKQMKLDEAREEGVEKGRTEERIQVVKRLLAKQFSPKDIAIIAGVTVAFVEKVKKGTR
jgi:predicted transposase/invertase (TIGR01784 family)